MASGGIFGHGGGVRDKPIRPTTWENGDAIYARYPALPGFFVFWYAGVMACKWVSYGVRLATWREARPSYLALPPPEPARLPPPDHSLRAPPIH